MMPGTLLYDLVHHTSQAMISQVESLLRSVRDLYASDEEFQKHMSRTITKDGYTVYLNDGKPVFYSHFWVDQSFIHFTISTGEPAGDWRSRQNETMDGFS